MAATSGVQASWAVAGTAIASASQRGSHLARASRHPGASSRIPAVAATESAKPTLVARPGSTSRRATTAAPSARVPRWRPSVPIASRPTVPIAAARTTLGSVRASSTKPTIPTAPTAYSQRPRTPHHRASTSRKPTTRVRLVPDTASRWVSPVVRKSSASPGSRPSSSPSTSAGTSARWLGGRSATDARIESRTACDPRHHTSGPVSTSGSPRAETTAARPGSSAGESRAVVRSVLPNRTSSHERSASTSTGVDSPWVDPRPVTRTARPRTRTRSS